MEASLALAGQTVGLIHEVLPVADIIARTVEGFHAHPTGAMDAFGPRRVLSFNVDGIPLLD